MKIIKYTNSLGAEIIFKQTALTQFILKKFEAGTGVNNNTFKGANQDGNTYINSTLGENAIELSFAIKGTTPELYSKYRKKLYQVFNPKLGEGTLTHNDGVNELKIKCIPEEVPFLVDVNTNIGEGLISLSANDPLWMNLSEQREAIAFWLGDFTFPLEILESGILIGHREPSLIVNCINNGDTKAGIRIEFRALATLTNPSLFNVNMREEIKIIKTMVPGEVLTITTSFGNKKIISKLNGVETNAFSYIDEDSEFLQLYPGDNLFRYDAESGIDNLEVTIYHADRFLGV